MIFKNRSVAILFAGLFVVMLGFGIIIPVLPLYARSLGATSLHLGLLMATFSFFQFFFAPIWGSLSDRIGRKPVLMIGLVGYMLAHVINGLANSIWILFSARILGGVLSSATIPTSLAFVSDVTDDKERGSGMGILGAAMGLGVIFGPSMGGFVSHYFNSYRMPFFLAAVLVTILLPLAYFFLPETNKMIKTDTITSMQSNRIKSNRFQELVNALRGNLAFYFILTFLVSFAAANLEGIFSFFAMDKFNYGTKEIGIIFTVIGTVAVILQGVLVGKAINRYGENRLIFFGLLITALGFYLITRAKEFLPLTVYVALNMAGGAFLRPSINSAVSKKTLTGQGVTMGLIGSFDSLGRIAGPVWAGLVYKWGINYPFLTGAAITFVGMVAAPIIFNRKSK